MQNRPPSLQISEWILFFSFVCIILSLFLVSKVTSARSLDSLRAAEKPLRLPVEMLSVEIRGSVQKPGIYSVPKGTTARIALRKARPKPFADLRSLALDQILEEATSFDLPALKEIHVEVRGCVVENRTLTLPVGSRISDLKGKLDLTPEANKAFFKRQRLLKEGEIIEVPKIVSDSQ
jgi:hypothetical protein